MLNYNSGAIELDKYYSENYDASEITNKAREIWNINVEKNLSLCLIKANIHEMIANEAEVIVFKDFPFFWEAKIGRSRYDWGCHGSTAASYLRDKTWQFMGKLYNEDIKKYQEAGVLTGWSPVGYDHHAPNYDILVERGLLDIIREAEERILTVETQDERDFLNAVIKSNRAAIRLAERFAEKAELMLKENNLSNSSSINLKRIAQAAKRVPAYPAENFYEAIACILYARELVGTFEAFGVSTFGHLDRILNKYYEKDSANGKIDKAEAEDLINALLAFTDAKFAISDSNWHETSTTIVLGGCDRDGEPVFNEITRIFVQACIENRYVGTKIIMRLNSKQSKEYFKLLGEFVLSRANVLVMPNDDTLVKSNVNWNKKLEDARLYVGGGCHEMVIGGFEVCTRADNWLNLPKVLLETFCNNYDNNLFKELGFNACENYDNFDEFYKMCLKNVKSLHDNIAGIKTKYEKNWSKYEATPFYSGLMSDCVKNAKDITAGGARYNSVSLSMVGAATFIDSLWAIKKIVFENSEENINNNFKKSLKEMREILANNWQGHEDLREFIKNKLERYGQSNYKNNELNINEFEKFAVEIMNELANCAGQPNGRGGVFTPAFYPHSLFIDFGRNLGATPDGRKSGEFLSRGISPSEFTPISSATDIINSLKSLDLSQFPESMATEITLPVTRGKDITPEIIGAFIRVFVKNGGSTLQINILSHEELIEAKANPEKYRNLIVRVCGFSQAFNSLSEEGKNEVISRAERAV